MYKKHKSLLVPALLLCSTTAYSAAFPGDQASNGGASSGGNGVLIALDDSITVVPNNTSTGEGDAAVISTSKVEGNVTANDKNGSFVELIGSPISSNGYGYLNLSMDGSFSYTLYTDAPDIAALKVGEERKDTFRYAYVSESGQRKEATLNVTIIGNPVDANGNVVFQQNEDPYDNVDIEFNNRSAQATPLNSGKNIRGHLHHSGDKDWYRLARAKNEVVTLEVCPKGSSCFGKKSWVLYVFDSEKLTPEMEEKVYPFDHWVDETGSTKDESGQNIISGSNGTSNHMYLAYNAGFFEGALIGVVDPCFDTLNTVDIGVNDDARDYIVAISSPLKGSSGDEKSCGQGSVVLTKPGRNALGKKAAQLCSYFKKTAGSVGEKVDIVKFFKASYGEKNEDGEFEESEDKTCKVLFVEQTGSPNKWTVAAYNDGGKFLQEEAKGDLLTNLEKDINSEETLDLALATLGRSKPVGETETYTTTKEYISVFPNSDDQYSINVTKTGTPPLASDDAKLKSSTYKLDIGELMIPKVRILDKLYSANLNLQSSVASKAKKGGNLTFGLTNLNPLGAGDSGDAYQSTYNPGTQQVMIPRVMDVVNNKAYSVIMQYYPATGNKNESLEVVDYEMVR